MAANERQKYNFLVALTRQLREANRDESDCAAEFVELLNTLLDIVEGGATAEEWRQRATQLDDRIGKCEQWLAALETALESLEQVVSAWDDQDAEEPDDGDDVEDVGTMEPPLGGLERAPRRGAVALGDTSGQQGVDGRNLVPPQAGMRRLIRGQRGQG